MSTYSRPNKAVLQRSIELAQYLSIRYSERLAANEIVASVGSRGDSYDNALAESFNGLYKWELIYRQGPWQGLDDVEFATMTYIDWFNHKRLHGTMTAEPGLHHPSRPRSHLLPSDNPGHRAGHPITRAVTRPGALHLFGGGSACVPAARGGQGDPHGVVEPDPGVARRAPRHGFQRPRPAWSPRQLTRCRPGCRSSTLIAPPHV